MAVADGPSALQVFVSGRVQGVAFRWSTRSTARALGVTGWVRNLDDRRVEAWIEGEPDAVAAMRAWLGEGPSAARVDHVEAHEQARAGHVDFEIRPDGRA